MLQTTLMDADTPIFDPNLLISTDDPNDSSGNHDNNLSPRHRPASLQSGPNQRSPDKTRKRRSKLHSRQSCDPDSLTPTHSSGATGRTAIITRDYMTEATLLNAQHHLSDSSQPGDEDSPIAHNASGNFYIGNNESAALQSCFAFIIDEPDKAYAQYMYTRRVYDVIPVNTKFVVLDINLSVRKAFYALIYNGVRSALLWNSQDSQFCGLLTVTDFINMVLHAYNNSPDHKVKNIEDQVIKDWRDLLDNQKKLKPLLFVNVNDSLLKATTKLIGARFHRIPIFDDNGANALHFLTHKRILRYLYLVIDKLPLPAFMSKSVRDLGVGSYQELLSVDQHTPLVECLRRLTSRNLSALPVLNRYGVVVDIYARFDAITLAAESAYYLLDKPVAEALMHRKKYKWYKGVITCVETDSLKHVIDTLYSSEVHGIVVVDGEGKLRGVITLYDVLKFIIVDQAKPN